MTMDVKDFDYELPEELIAQDPLEDRSASQAAGAGYGKQGRLQHQEFLRISLEYLRPGRLPGD